MIYVVDEHMIGDFENLAVHLDNYSFAVLQTHRPLGVKGAVGYLGVPFLFVEPGEIIRFNNGVFALG